MIKDSSYLKLSNTVEVNIKSINFLLIPTILCSINHLMWERSEKEGNSSVKRNTIFMIKSSKDYHTMFIE